jgi:hypothetical protein
MTRQDILNIIRSRGSSRVSYAIDLDRLPSYRRKEEERKASLPPAATDSSILLTQHLPSTYKIGVRHAIHLATEYLDAVGLGSGFTKHVQSKNLLPMKFPNKNVVTTIRELQRNKIDNNKIAGLLGDWINKNNMSEHAYTVLGDEAKKFATETLHRKF